MRQGIFEKEVELVFTNGCIGYTGVKTESWKGKLGISDVVSGTRSFDAIKRLVWVQLTLFERMSMQLTQVLNSLDRVFHSEADFQHELAWELHQRDVYSSIQLERRVTLSDVPPHLEEMHVDMWVKRDGEKIPIELKYRTAEFSGTMGDEDIKLRSHGAHPPGRFDVVADIERIEAIVEQTDTSRGFVILLANDPAYWREPTQDVIDADFRLHDKLHGTLSWADHASQSTKTKKRDRSITLQNDYELNWRPYTYERPDQDLEGKQEFRYLMIEIE